MTIYTCSYNEYKPHMGTAVRISLGVPPYEIPGFNPSTSIMKAAPDWAYMNTSVETYNKYFYAQINDYGVENYRKEFERIRKSLKLGKNAPLVLLCFEKLGKLECSHEDEVIQTEQDTCHRRKFAEWWKDQTGETIEELGTRVRLKVQLEMF